jgi:hypothetical protein
MHAFDLEQARSDGDWRDLVQTIMALPECVHRPLWQYLGLFQGKQQIRSIKMLRIVKELGPMIREAKVARNRIDYVVTAQQFARAMQYLVDTRPESLVLPLKSNGYLLGMLANQAEQQLARAEAKHDENLRAGNRPVETQPQPQTPATPKAPKEDAPKSKTKPEDWNRLTKKLGVSKPPLNDD